MKFAIVAASLALSCSAALAAGQGQGQGQGNGQDPNAAPAHGSFTASSHANPMGIANSNANSVLSTVPEADTVAMLVAGVAVVGGLALRRRNKR